MSAGNDLMWKEAFVLVVTVFKRLRHNDENRTTERRNMNRLYFWFVLSFFLFACTLPVQGQIGSCSLCASALTEGIKLAKDDDLKCTAAQAAADCYKAAKCDNSDAADKAVSEHCAGSAILPATFLLSGLLLVSTVFQQWM
uniref:Uncharacterized protein LOC111121502 n=1 Tax=Crassostrea virginica TaxID=6565 RepID=A0A8B8CTH8_CRAVI|nr:uncharacterized protein LOC111121502 [Crassostrea virginica]